MSGILQCFGQLNAGSLDGRIRGLPRESDSGRPIQASKETSHMKSGDRGGTGNRQGVYPVSYGEHGVLQTHYYTSNNQPHGMDSGWLNT